MTDKNDPTKAESTEPTPAEPVNKTEVQTGRAAPTTETVTQDRPESKLKEVEEPQSYVWLANGQVHRVNDKDLPGASGAQNPHGHWQTGNKVYEVVGIYPVESVVEEN
jgi:hypothetical protein